MADIDEVIADLERRVLEFTVPSLTTEQHVRLECIRLVTSFVESKSSFRVVDAASRLVNFVLTGSKDIPAAKDG